MGALLSVTLPEEYRNAFGRGLPFVQYTTIRQWAMAMTKKCVMLNVTLPRKH